MIARRSGRIYLWISLAALSLVLAIGFGASGAFAGFPARVASGPPVPAAGQQEKAVTSINSTGSTDTTKPASPNSILYDQYNSPSGAAVSSQLFGNASDDQAADDFTVPAGPGWRITQVDVNGSYSIVTSTATLANVYFYSNAISGTYAIPGAAVYTATNQSTVQGASGAYVVPLALPAVLSPGTYWVSVQATGMATGQWFWQERTVQNLNKATWRNPPGGFGTFCTTSWDQRTFCIADTAPDQEFRLWGDPVGANTSTATPTPTATPTRPPCGGGPNWIVGNPYLSNIVRAAGVWFPGNSKFYSLGGRTADGVGNDLINPREFTPGGQGTWAVKSGAFDDAQVDNMVAAVLTQGGTDYIFTVGGSAGGTTVATAKVRRYDPVGDVITVVTTDPWPELVNSLPGGVAVYNNKLYIFGGFDVANTIANADIWEFDPNGTAGSRWTLKAATLPVPMAYIPAATIGSTIYTAGGTTISEGALTDSDNSYQYDPVADEINPIATIPRATGETRALNVDGKMWVMGGGRTSPNPGNQVDIYDPGTNSWSAGLSFAGARRNFPVDVRPGTGDRVYLVGGYQPTTPSSDMQIYALAAPCINTFTPTNTPTKTNTRTATRTQTCLPVLRAIGPDNPGKLEPAHKPANSTASFGAAGSVNSVRAGKLPDSTDNAPVAFELDDGTRENSIGFGSTVSNTESAAIWLNRFSPPAGAYPITINKLHIWWPVQTGALTDTIIGKSARLVIYRANASGAPITNTTLIYQEFVTVGVTETFQTYNLASPPTIAGVNGEDLYIGFEDFWAESGNFQPRFFPAAIDQTPPSQVRSWVVGNGNGAPPNVANLGDPNNDTVGTIDGFGLPGNSMIRASGITSLADPCPATRTSTPTNTATPAAQLSVHLIWQGIAQPSSRNTTETVTTTLRLASGGPNIEYGPVNTDLNGNYTIPVGSVPNGTYIIRAKGHKNLSSGTATCDTVTLTGVSTSKDLGTVRAGDALSTGPTNFNVVNSSDFTTLKNTFGKAFGQPGYCECGDFNQTDNVDATDFSLQKGNFGSAGCPNP